MKNKFIYILIAFNFTFIGTTVYYYNKSQTAEQLVNILINKDAEPDKILKAKIYMLSEENKILKKKLSSQ